MKIKTAEWLGIEFSNAASMLRLDTYNQMWAANQRHKATGYNSAGHAIDRQLADFGDEIIENLCSLKGWKHYLFTEKALKLASNIIVDENFNHGMLANLPVQHACYMPSPKEFFRWYIDPRVGIVVMYVRHKGPGEYDRYSFAVGMKHDPTQDPSKHHHWERTQQLLRLIVFTELTDVELLVVESGQKSSNTKAPESQRVTNQTGVPITRVHAHWNTFYINTSIIDVRGFTRQQAYGKGRLLRKEVLIAPHTRNGYKREEKH